MRENARIACEDILHFRPLTILAKICMLFPNTDFSVVRLHPGPKESTSPADPKHILSMVMQCFANGEEVGIQASGDEAHLGAVVLKTVFENMTTLYTEADANRSEAELRKKMYLLLESALAGVRSSGRAQLLKQAQVSLLQAEPKVVKFPCTTYESSAILADRLHNAIVEVLPLVAQHFRSALVLSFPQGIGREKQDYDLSKSDNSWSRFGLLASAPVAGTRVVVNTNGRNAQHCAECVAGILRLLPVVDDYIRAEGLRAATKTKMIEGIVQLIHASMLDPQAPHIALPSRKPVLHDLLTDASVEIIDRQIDKDTVLSRFAALHETQTGVPAQTILEQVYIRERHIPCFENGVAIPHARVDSGPLVSIYLGLYSRGVPWVDGNKAFVVLLFIAAADAPETYGAYLAQACRILRDQDSMNDLLRARTKTDALAAIRLAEVRMGAPLPTVEARKVLVVESIADEQTLLRDRMINENPRMEGVRVEYFYACSERDGDIQFDPLVFEEALRSRIERGNPDFVLLHTGIAFRRYKEGLTRVFKSLRGQFPKVRFGCQESRAIAVDSEAFDHDSQTLKFQQEFFTVGHGG